MSPVQNIIELKELSVLFVEDDSYARKSMEIILGSLFGKVRVASNGAEGLRAFLDETADIVITDLFMPEMTGYEMIAEMKARKPQLVVIIMSACDNQDFERSKNSLGIFGCLKKPFTLENFETVLRDAGKKVKAI